MPKSNAKLLPCPLCEDAMISRRGGGVFVHGDEHQDCPLWTVKVYPEQVELWNRRPRSINNGSASLEKSIALHDAIAKKLRPFMSRDDADDLADDLTKLPELRS